MPSFLYFDGATGRPHNSGIEIDIDTSPPGAPSTDWLWYNKGSGSSPDGLYRYTGTRWLGEVQEKPMPFKPGLIVPLTATASRAAKYTRGHALASIYVETVTLRYKVTSANSGFSASHFWTYQFGGIFDDDSNSAFGSPTSTWQSFRAADTYYLDTLTVNTVYSNSIWGFYMDLVRDTGTPGNLDIDTITLSFRYVGA